MRLTEKYKPTSLDQFIGLQEPKKVIGRWLENPYPMAFLFQGDSGTGKTTLALSIARHFGINPNAPDSHFSFIHVASQKCNVESVNEIQERIRYAPWAGYWVILIDEADCMSPAAQIAFLSLLDAIPEKTVIVFTCNETDRLEPRFLSRCCVVKFSNYGLNGAGAAFLADVWRKESGTMKQVALIEPDFARIMKNQRNNIRAGLMEIERELMSA